MYISGDGTIHEGGQPWGLKKLIGFFWTFINFIVVFFKTLFNFDTADRTTSRAGSTGSGPNDPPGGARRRMGRINTLPECNIPGGG